MDDQKEQQELFIKLYDNIQQNSFYIGYPHWSRFVAAKMKLNGDLLHPALDSLLSIPKKPQLDGKWRTWYEPDPNAKPAKELRRFALRDKFSKEPNEKDTKEKAIVWPRPDSQSLSYSSDDRSSESGGPRRRSKAKKMPKSFVTASIIIEQSDGESDSQGSPTKVKLTEKHSPGESRKVDSETEAGCGQVRKNNGRFKSL